MIAAEGGCKLVKVNAVTSNVADLRDALKMVRYHGAENCYLFVDEIHRFNKAQQDLLLPDVESGEARLIGATTHNPRYYVIDPLLSRSQLFALEPLPTDEIEMALSHALKDEERGLGTRSCKADKKVLERIALLAEGDLRRAYNFIETIVEALPEWFDGNGGRGGGVLPGTEHPLRPGRRRTLRYRFGVYQEHAGKRPGCGFVLAGENVGGRRGSALHREKIGDFRIGRRGDG